MKIASAKLFLTEYNRSNTPEFPKKSKVVGIRIYTDEGIYGDGEVAGIHATFGAFGVIKDMWPFIAGRDPFENEVLWGQLMGQRQTLLLRIMRVPIPIPQSSWRQLSRTAIFTILRNPTHLYFTITSM